MASQSSVTLRHIIDILKREDSRCSLTWKKVKVHDIDAREFLSFAKRDLEENSEGGRVNSLSNAKRAIECRIDEILTLLNFRGFSTRKGWKLPYKMQVLQTFGVAAPLVLRNLITSKRNLLEHEYVRPERQEVQNIVDIAELFLEATDAYIERGYIASATIDLPDEGPLTAELHEELLGRLKSRGFIRRNAKKASVYRAYTNSEYSVIFDLDKEEVVLEYSERKSWTCSLEAGHLVSWDRPAIDKRLDTLALHDCAMEDIRELMILLRK